MDAREHIERAEELLALAERLATDDDAGNLVPVAQVHATLAVAKALVLEGTA